MKELSGPVIDRGEAISMETLISVERRSKAIPLVRWREATMVVVAKDQWPWQAIYLSTYFFPKVSKGICGVPKKTHLKNTFSKYVI